MLAKAKALEQDGRKIIHLEIGEPDFDTPAHIAAAAKEALERGHTHYVPAPGIPELRTEVADFLEHTGRMHTTPDRVVVTPGAKPIMFFTIMVLAQRRGYAVGRESSAQQLGAGAHGSPAARWARVRRLRGLDAVPTDSGVAPGVHVWPGRLGLPGQVGGDGQPTGGHTVTDHMLTATLEPPLRPVSNESGSTCTRTTQSPFRRFHVCPYRT